MTKIRMLYRHGGLTGKMEKGLVYQVPESYALELVKAGLAEYYPEPEKIPEIEDATQENIKVAVVGKRVKVAAKKIKG